VLILIGTDSDNLHNTGWLYSLSNNEPELNISVSDRDGPVGGRW
jgi:hypothetical protein